ncbi:DNA-binding Lrp family transcriptional regulator [Leucobacter luti]|uniref:Lrp/AsnC family transcriptional regulator n=1 Tax=Leucobacter luti TaxID=340320 RepID=UPI001045851F|nr:Lrp/AsnC family transcriptional regulator [Leucobacter luti]MCW2289944.1 DNA-binding Lrp family transcriptional regulator [Leucobacter luti]TCK33258.1 DNA-binding Lrp family transcriptional regulator [Leucobacter luti]
MPQSIAPMRRAASASSTDELRTRILRELRDDGRASFARIAERHGTTRRQVTQIVQHAIDRGLLRITVSISPDLLGHERFAYLQIAVDGPIAEIREALVAMPETTFVAEISGSFAIDAEIRVGADPHLRETVDRIRALPHVREIRLHLYESIEINLYSPIRTGGAGMQVDDADRAIVQHLQQDGRASFRELGDAAGVSPSGARLRLRRLMDRGAVKVVGIPVRGNLPEAPTLGVGVQVTSAVADAIARVRELDPEFLAVAVGGYDMILTLSGESNDDVLELVDRLRSFPEISRIDSWANLRIVKEQYGEGDRIITSARRAQPSPL